MRSAKLKTADVDEGFWTSSYTPRNDAGVRHPPETIHEMMDG